MLLLDWTVQIRQGTGRRRNTPATLFRSGAGRYSPECGDSGVPGLGLAWNLAVEDQSRTGSPPAGVVRVREGCGGARREGGDSAVVELADEHRPGS